MAFQRVQAKLLILTSLSTQLISTFDGPSTERPSPPYPASRVSTRKSSVLFTGPPFSPGIKKIRNICYV